MAIDLKVELTRANMKITVASEKMGMKYLTFYRKLQKKTFTLTEAENLLEIVGYKIELKKIS